MSEAGPGSTSATGEEITINIRAPKDAKIAVSIATSKQIKDLKQEISTKVEDCPPERQRLIYSGRVLKDDDTIASYKVQNGNSIHLVKSAAPTEPAPAAARVPEQINAGQQIAGNPLAPLMNATHPGLGGFNPFAQMGVNQNDPNMMQNLMQTPDFQRQMNQMLSDPAIIDQMIQMSPELRAMGPQARVIMQSPMFRQMLSNPQAMTAAMQAAQAGGLRMGGPGAPGLGGGQQQQPGLFGLAQQQQQQQQQAAAGTPTGTAAGATPGAPMPDLANLFGTGSPFGQFPNATQAGDQTAPPAPDWGALMQMMGGANAFGGGAGGGFGGGGFGGVPSTGAAAGPPPEERYADQLAQLAGMGFNNARQNVRALLATGGNVEHAVTFILEGGGLN